mgnify:CR=1 FL=1
MMKRNRIYPTNNRNWTTIHIDLTTKRMLNDLSWGNESYDDTIIRLIKRRTFDMVNGEIVDISEYKKDGEVREELDYINKELVELDKKVNPDLQDKEMIRIIGR